MSRAVWIETCLGCVYSSSRLWYSSSSSGVRMPMDRMLCSSKNLRSLLVSSTYFSSCGSLYFSLKRRAYSAIRASSPFVLLSLFAAMISLASIVLTTVLPLLRWKYTLHQSCFTFTSLISFAFILYRALPGLGGYIVSFCLQR